MARELIRARPRIVRVLSGLGMGCLVLLGLVALTGSALHLTGHVRAATVVSGSMEPGIPTGSLVVGWSQEPSEGDVVMGAREDGTFVTHRVIEVLNDGGFRMQGDANESPDAQAYAGDSWTVKARVPHLGSAFRWVVDEPLALIGLGLVAGVVLGGVIRPSTPTSSERRGEVASARSRGPIVSDQGPAGADAASSPENAGETKVAVPA